MSTATSVRVPAPATPPPGARRAAPLWLVPQRRSTAAKAPFVVAVVGLLVAGLLGLLLLNTIVAQDAFRLHDLQKQGRLLADREQELAKQVQGLQAPGSLSDHAIALGMVPGGPPVFLRLPDGAVLGAVTAPSAAPRAVVAAAARPAATTAPAAGAATKPPAATKPTAGPATAVRTSPSSPRQAPAPRHTPAPRASAGTH